MVRPWGSATWQGGEGAERIHNAAQVAQAVDLGSKTVGHATGDRSGLAKLLKLKVDIFAEELRVAREFNDAVQSLLQEQARRKQSHAHHNVTHTHTHTNSNNSHTPTNINTSSTFPHNSADQTHSDSNHNSNMAPNSAQRMRRFLARTYSSTNNDATNTTTAASPTAQAATHTDFERAGSERESFYSNIIMTLAAQDLEERKRRAAAQQQQHQQQQQFQQSFRSGDGGNLTEKLVATLTEKLNNSRYKEQSYASTLAQADKVLRASEARNAEHLRRQRECEDQIAAMTKGGHSMKQELETALSAENAQQAMAEQLKSRMQAQERDLIAQNLVWQEKERAWQRDKAVAARKHTELMELRDAMKVLTVQLERSERDRVQERSHAQSELADLQTAVKRMQSEIIDQQATHRESEDIIEAKSRIDEMSRQRTSLEEELAKGKLVTMNMELELQTARVQLAEAQSQSQSQNLHVDHEMELTAVRDERDQLKAQVAEASVELTAVKGQLVDANLELTAIQQRAAVDAQGLRSQLADALLAVAAVKGQLEEAHQELTAVKNQAATEAQELRSQLADELSEVAAVKGHSEKAGQELTAVKDQAATEAQELRSQLADALSEVAAVKGHLQKARQELTAIKDQAATEAQELRSELTKTRSELTAVQGEMETLTAVSAEIETSAQAQSARHAALTAELDALKSQLSEAQSELQASTKATSNALDELSEAKSEVAEVKAALQERTQAHAHAEARLDEAQSTLTAIRGELETCLRNQSEAESRLAKSQVEVTTVKQQLEGSMRLEAEAKLQLDESQSEVMAMQTEIKMRIQSQSDSEAQLAESQSQLTTMKQLLEDSESQLSTSQQRLTEVKEELDMRSRIQSETELTLTDLRSQLTAVTAELASLTTVNTDLQAQLTRTQSELTAVSKELAASRRAQEELKALAEELCAQGEAWTKERTGLLRDFETKHEAVTQQAESAAALRAMVLRLENERDEMGDRIKDWENLLHLHKQTMESNEEKAAARERELMEKMAQLASHCSTEAEGLRLNCAKLEEKQHNLAKELHRSNKQVRVLVESHASELKSLEREIMESQRLSQEQADQMQALVSDREALISEHERLVTEILELKRATPKWISQVDQGGGADITGARSVFGGLEMQEMELQLSRLRRKTVTAGNVETGADVSGSAKGKRPDSSDSGSQTDAGSESEHMSAAGMQEELTNTKEQLAQAVERGDSLATELSAAVDTAEELRELLCKQEERLDNSKNTVIIANNNDDKAHAESDTVFALRNANKMLQQEVAHLAGELSTALVAQDELAEKNAQLCSMLQAGAGRSRHEVEGDFEVEGAQEDGFWEDMMMQADVGFWDRTGPGTVPGQQQQRGPAGSPGEEWGPGSPRTQQGRESPMPTIVEEEEVASPPLSNPALLPQSEYEEEPVQPLPQEKDTENEDAKSMSDHSEYNTPSASRRSTQERMGPISVMPISPVQDDIVSLQLKMFSPEGDAVSPSEDEDGLKLLLQLQSLADPSMLSKTCHF
eukprot:jgi/Chlat1/4533/Chrsp29S04589